MLGAMTSYVPPTPLRFHRTAPLPCPYLAGRTERNLFAELGQAGAAARHDRLIHAGFRRSHTIVYRPACPGCGACVPVRIAVPAFRPTRSLKRVQRGNSDLAERSRPPAATAEHFALFQRYQASRHGDGEMAQMGFADYRAMVEDGAAASVLFEHCDPAGEVLAVSLTDRVADGYSAVYSFFDPRENKRSLGTYAILALVARAACEGRRHVYLGYWIEASPKMAYKARFPALERLLPEGWSRSNAGKRAL